MSVLKQVAILVYRYLKSCLDYFLYKPIKSTIGMRKYKSRGTKFYLCLDDFRTKYQSKEDTECLCNAIGVIIRHAKEHEGNNYCSLHLDQNYKRGCIDISIPKSMPQVLEKFNSMRKISLQHSPHKYIMHGKRGSKQLVSNDTLHLLPKKA